MKLSKNLFLRAVTSIVLFSFVIWVFFLGALPLYCFAVLMILLSCIELMRMVHDKFYLICLIVLMVIIPYSALMYIYIIQKNVFIWLMLCVWATDIAAYSFGKIIGGKKILSIISPKKTWSGLIGGVVMSWICGLLTAYFLKLPYYFLFLGAPIAIVSQIGDFFESAVKRVYSVNDSGYILPGHGGVLDRMDGVIFTAPMITWFLW